MEAYASGFKYDAEVNKSSTAACAVLKATTSLLRPAIKRQRHDARPRTPVADLHFDFVPRCGMRGVDVSHRDCLAERRGFRAARHFAGPPPLREDGVMAARDARVDQFHADELPLDALFFLPDQILPAQKIRLGEFHDPIEPRLER